MGDPHLLHLNHGELPRLQEPHPGLRWCAAFRSQRPEPHGADDPVAGLQRAGTYWALSTGSGDPKAENGWCMVVIGG